MNGRENKRRSHRGFNLVEVLLVLSLLILVISLGAPSISMEKKKASVRAASMVFIQELRSARQKAIDTQKPIAVVIPSGNGLKAHAVGYYILEGYDNPRITKIVNWENEYPGAYIFTGFWDLTSGSNTTDEPDPNTNDFQIDMDSWGGPGKDYVIMFTPRGTVKTNGLPNFDNDFHIVITKGVSYSMMSISGSFTHDTALDDTIWDDFVDLAFVKPGQFGKLDKVWMSSETVTITPLGNISMTDGILKWSGNFESGDPPGGLMQNPATPPPSSSMVKTNNAPELLEVEILPVPNPVTLSPGVQSTCHVKSHNTFVIKAKDVDGDELFARVKCTPEGGAPTGWSFSAPENKDVPMERTQLEKNTDTNPVPLYKVLKPDNNADTQVLSVDWYPPSRSVYPQQYLVDVTVEDKKGGESSLSVDLGGPINVEILPRGRIVFVAMEDGSTDSYIFIMDADGTGPRKLFDRKAFQPALSPDGKKVAFVSDWNIYCMDLDGSNLITLVTDPSHKGCGNPCWSNDGTQIVFDGALNKTDGHELYLINSDGTGLHRLTYSPEKFQYMQPSWSPDGSKIAFMGTTDYISAFESYTEVMTIKPDGTGIEQITDLNGTVYDPNWSPDGTKLAFRYSTTGFSPPEIYTVNADKTGPTQITTGAFPIYLTWNLDGTKIAYDANRSGMGGGGSQIYVIDIQTKQEISATNSLSKYKLRSFSYPNWGKD